MMKALAHKHQDLLTESLRHAKSFSKYWGITALIFVVLFAAGTLLLIGEYLLA